MDDYGMYTSRGDALIKDFIALVDRYQLNDRSINAMLLAISENETFSESFDTVVRAIVFAKLQRSS